MMTLTQTHESADFQSLFLDREARLGGFGLVFVCVSRTYGEHIAGVFWSWSMTGVRGGTTILQMACVSTCPCAFGTLVVLMK